LKLGIGKK